LRAELGDVVFDESGGFARKRVAAIAFENEEFLKTLTRVTHRFIIDRISRMVEDIGKASPGSVIVIDAPIPVKRGFLDMSDQVWVVTADYGVRIERIIARDGLSEHEAEARMKSQLSDKEYADFANRLAPNNGSLAELKDTLLKMWKELKKMREKDMLNEENGV
jgi:dephospho-CoA kinase